MISDTRHKNIAEASSMIKSTSVGQSLLTVVYWMHWPLSLLWHKFQTITSSSSNISTFSAFCLSNSDCTDISGKPFCRQYAKGSRKTCQVTLLDYQDLLWIKFKFQRRRHCVLRNALSNSFVARREYARWKSIEIVIFLTLFFQGGDPELGEEVVTTGGPDAGAFCVFPFIWKSKVHRSCAKVRTVSFFRR